MDLGDGRLAVQGADQAATVKPPELSLDGVFTAEAP
jgi:hypothetical protein